MCFGEGRGGRRGFQHGYISWMVCGGFLWSEGPRVSKFTWFPGTIALWENLGIRKRVSLRAEGAEAGCDSVGVACLSRKTVGS